MAKTEKPKAPPQAINTGYFRTVVGPEGETYTTITTTLKIGCSEKIMWRALAYKSLMDIHDKHVKQLKQALAK